MLRILFLVLMSSFFLAQISSAQATPPRKLADFGVIVPEFFNARVDAFIQELQNEPTARGFVLNYGSDAAVLRNESSMKERLALKKFDLSRVTFVNGGFLDERKTEFWLVPAKSESPKFTQNARKFDEFGKLGAAELNKRVQSFRAKLESYKAVQNFRVLIFNYGTERDVTFREKYIATKLLDRCNDCFGYDNSVVKMVRGGDSAEPKTVFWIVPAGAELPKP